MRGGAARWRACAAGLLVGLLAGGMTPGLTARASVDAPPASSSDAATPRWEWPVDPPHQVTRPFQAPTTAYGPGHRGIDIAVAPGDEVRAPAAGTVSFAGVVVERPVVSIRHADGYVSSVEPVVPLVAAGDAVVAGQVIGTLAASPRHAPDGGLHLGARLHGDYVDPALLLAALQHAVLLPLVP
ncbi:M23 family peptidase [Clavibacter michiganensis subsp. michiganensis]|uniref:murein hydrolase activator EnvC family protein n=2 Tax=Clavibacter michiganensis TaxID=28447 RepID=UPI0013651BA5|nr:M23 family metallopeptidase [Clavibacter michiganensis]MBE3078269.1 M23 family metallopeptidase [Clavibacter michiganensis subsp. michiganensis]MWJ15600.1 M23 family peptidase [Clavibacter michiganensis subsp. michiganensis]